jgi:F-type H+-transporting ATPase subunit alpha
MEKQVIIIFAATNGYLDRYPVAECRRYEKELYAFLDARYAALLKEIAEKKDLKGAPTDKLKAALAEFAEVFQVRTEEGEAPAAKVEAPAKPGAPAAPAH